MKKIILLALMALPMSVFAQKFAHFNAAEVIQAMPEYTEGMQKIQKDSQSYEQEFNRLQDELRTKYEAYQKDAATLPDVTRQRREQELQDINKRLEEYAQTSQQDIQQKNNALMDEVTEKVGKTLKEIGTEGGYVYIVETGSMAFINETLSTDITPQIKTKLGIK